MKIFDVGKPSVHLYLVVSETHRLLIDSGFPGALNHLGRAMRKTGYKVTDIDYLIVTHFHIDHAGAIQEIKDQGVRFILFDHQQDFIKPMEDMAVGKWKYHPLILHDNIVMKTEDSKAFLTSINIHGVVVSTPGHTKDSISLILDTGEAFTGDLSAEYLLMDKDVEQKKAWIKLKQLGIKTVFPGHGNPYTV